jgi:hypothetical protein
MQLTGGLVLCGLAALASANPQGGFFGGLGGLFNRFQGRPQGGGGGGGGGCRPSGPNHNFGGRNYLVSWRLGCTQFSQVKSKFTICMIKKYQGFHNSTSPLCRVSGSLIYKCSRMRRVKQLAYWRNGMSPHEFGLIFF